MWYLTAIAAGMCAWSLATVYIARLLTSYWLETEGREMVRRELRRLDR